MIINQIEVNSSIINNNYLSSNCGVLFGVLSQSVIKIVRLKSNNYVN